MSQITSYTIESAPEETKPLLQEIQNSYGFMPNIFADMAESPLPIKLYKYGQTMANNEATLSAEEVNIVQLATSVSNRCEFCVPAHSTLGRGKLKTDDAVIDAIRNGEDGPNERINALVRFTQLVTEKRGHVDDAAIDAFLNAGYSKAQIFEVITIVAYKVVTNYTSAIAGTKPNAQFAAEAWSASDSKRRAA